MTDRPKPVIGAIAWTDLTIEDAEQVSEFYAAVAGWKPEGVDMGGYNDFNMTLPDTGHPVAGICHSRGVNADIPPQWMIYVNVENLDASIRECNSRGGRVVAGPKGMGSMGRYCVIADPAGAVMALFEQAVQREEGE